MASDRATSPLIRFGPAIFIGLGVLISCVVVVMGLHGEFRDRVTEAQMAVNEHQKRIAADNPADAQATGNANLLALAETKKLESPKDVDALTKGFDVDYSIAVRLPAKEKKPDTTTTTTEPDTTTTETTEPKNALLLIAPHAAGAAPDDARKAIFIEWNSRNRISTEKAPDDIGYIVLRTTANAEGKADMAGFEPLFTTPIQAMRYVDTKAAPDKAYFYAVVQVTKSEAEVSGVDESIAKLPNLSKELSGYKFSAATVSSAPAILAPPGDMPEWYIDEVALGSKPPVSVVLRRWDYLKDRQSKEPFWLRMTLRIEALPDGELIGRKYSIDEMLSGKVGTAALDCSLELATFDGDGFVVMGMVKQGEKEVHEIELRLESNERRNQRSFATKLTYRAQDGDREHITVSFLPPGTTQPQVQTIAIKDRKWMGATAITPAPVVDLDPAPVIEEPKPPEDGQTPPDGATPSNN